MERAQDHELAKSAADAAAVARKLRLLIATGFSTLALADLASS